MDKNKKRIATGAAIGTGIGSAPIIRELVTGSRAYQKNFYLNRRLKGIIEGIKSNARIMKGKSVRPLLLRDLGVAGLAGLAGASVGVSTNQVKKYMDKVANYKEEIYKIAELTHRDRVRLFRSDPTVKDFKKDRSKLKAKGALQVGLPTGAAIGAGALGGEALAKKLIGKGKLGTVLGGIAGGSTIFPLSKSFKKRHKEEYQDLSKKRTMALGSLTNRSNVLEAARKMKGSGKYGDIRINPRHNINPEWV